MTDFWIAAACGPFLIVLGAVIWAVRKWRGR